MIRRPSSRGSERCSRRPYYSRLLLRGIVRSDCAAASGGAAVALPRFRRPGRNGPSLARWLRSLARLTRRGAQVFCSKRRLGVQHVSKTATIVRDGGQGLRDRVTRSPEGREEPESPIEQAIKRVEIANDEALSHYAPRVYEGRITLFRSDRVPAAFHGDPTMGWKSLAGGGVDIHEIPGDCPNVVDEPDVRILAEKLAACCRPASAERRQKAADRPRLLQRSASRAGARLLPGDWSTILGDPRARHGAMEPRQPGCWRSAFVLNGRLHRDCPWATPVPHPASSHVVRPYRCDATPVVGRTRALPETGRAAPSCL